LMVRVQVEGKHLVRCYSICSAPESAGFIEISVKRQGLVSGTLHATVQPGSRLSVQGPRGNFVYPEQDERPIVFIAGGVGITPLMGMLRHAVVADPSRPVTLLYSVRTEQDIAYRDELLLLSRRHPHLRVAIALSRGSSDRLYLSGRIDANLISGFVPDPRNPIYMICGPGPMIDAVRSLLHALGVAAPQIRSEAFEPASAAAATTATALEMARASVVVGSSGEAPTAHRHSRGSGSSGPEGARLTLARSGRTVAIGPGQSLLEAAESAGVEIPSLCRSGACGTCRTRLVKGQIEGDSTVLDEEDRAAGYILPCVVSTRGDCVLDA
jgi:ferredoxin-NADP reductase